MPNPLKALKGLSGLADTAVVDGRAAIRELLNIIKDGAKKDPAQIFLQERSTGFRVPSASQVKAPDGFEFGRDLRPSRSPIINKAEKIQRRYDTEVLGRGKDPRFRGKVEPVQRSTTPSVKSLEDLAFTRPSPSHGAPVQTTRKPLIQDGKDASRKRFDPSIRNAVLRDASGKGTAWEQTRELQNKYPNIKPNTIYSWLRNNKP